MDFLTIVVLSVFAIAALVIVVLVLLQHGKGADMGAAFGSGSAGSLFGSAGSANFLSRATSVAATVFFVAALLLAAGVPGRGDKSMGVLGENAKPGAAAAVVPAASVASQAGSQRIPD